MNLKKNFDFIVLKRYISQQYELNADRIFYHDWEHTALVHKYALSFARECNGDHDIVEASALLHDIGYIFNPQTKSHEEDSVKFMEEIFMEKEFGSLRQRMEEIAGCILATKQDVEAKSLNEMIVKDANLIQFVAHNYPMKVYDLYNEHVANGRISDISFRKFVKNTPVQMEKWVNYKEHTNNIFSTGEARRIAGKAYLQQKQLFECFGEVSDRLSDIQFEEFYMEFLASIEQFYYDKYNEIYSEKFVIDLAEKCKNKYMKYLNVKKNRKAFCRSKNEQEILDEAELRINVGISTSDITKYILREVVAVVPAQSATIYIVKDDKGAKSKEKIKKIYFTDTYFHNTVSNMEERRKTILEQPPIMNYQGIVGGVIKNSKYKIVDDALKDKDHLFKIARLVGLPSNSMITIPLIYNQSPIGAIQIINRLHGSKQFTIRDLALLEKVSITATFALERANRFEMLINGFIDDINEKDNYTRKHTENVKKYSEKIANLMGLSDDEINKISVSAILHDIGKIRIHDDILKRKGRLYDKEMNIMRRHVFPPSNIEEIIFPPYMEDVSFIASCHHEDVNGGGYPRGLKRDEIPLAARILRVADAFDAMTTKREYNKVKNNMQAIYELMKCKGANFDEEIVEIFIKYLLKHKMMNREVVKKKN